MLVPVLRLLARMPLRWLHGGGAALGWWVDGVSPTYRARLKENLFASGVCTSKNARRSLLRQAIAEAGKGVAELIAIWFGTEEKVSDLVVCNDWTLAEEAQRGGRGIIFLTTPLG